MYCVLNLSSLYDLLTLKLNNAVILIPGSGISILEVGVQDLLSFVCELMP